MPEIFLASSRIFLCSGSVDFFSDWLDPLLLEPEDDDPALTALRSESAVFVPVSTGSSAALNAVVSAIANSKMSPKKDFNGEVGMAFVFHREAASRDRSGRVTREEYKPSCKCRIQQLVYKYTPI